MVVVWGHKYNFEFLGKVDIPCPKCGQTPCDLCTGKKKFTFYWIPTFTIGREYVLGCPQCDQKWSMNQELGQRLHQDMLSKSYQT